MLVLVLSNLTFSGVGKIIVSCCRILAFLYHRPLLLTNNADQSRNRMLFVLAGTASDQIQN